MEQVQDPWPYVLLWHFHMCRLQTGQGGQWRSVSNCRLRLDMIWYYLWLMQALRQERPVDGVHSRVHSAAQVHPDTGRAALRRCMSKLPTWALGKISVIRHTQTVTDVLQVLIAVGIV